MEGWFGLGPYAGYIVWCYAAAAAVMVGLTLWTVLSDRATRRTLTALEARTPRRTRRETDA